MCSNGVPIGARLGDDVDRHSSVSSEPTLIGQLVVTRASESDEIIDSEGVDPDGAGAIPDSQPIPVRAEGKPSGSPRQNREGQKLAACFGVPQLGRAVEAGCGRLGSTAAARSKT
jgi:hypothetical protein